MSKTTDNMDTITQPAFDPHHQHKDADQQKLIDLFTAQVVDCPGVRKLATQCPYLSQKKVRCPFVDKLLSTQKSNEAGAIQGMIFAP